LTPTSHPGWFARDPVILNRVGQVLLQLLDVDLVRPSQIIIAEDCFRLSDIRNDRVTQPLVNSMEKLFGGKCIDHINLIFV
jgi:amidase